MPNFLCMHPLFRSRINELKIIIDSKKGVFIEDSSIRNVREPADYGIGRAVQRFGSVHTTLETIVRQVQETDVANPSGLRHRNRDDRDAEEKASIEQSQKFLAN